MLPTELSLMSLFRHTFAFFGDFARLKRLTTFPLLLLSLLGLAGLVKPAVLAGKEPDPVLNYFLIGAFLAVLLLILALTMVGVHRAVFGRDDGRFLLLRAGREEVRYLLALFRMLLTSVFLSAVLSAAVFAAVYHFAPQVFVPLPYLVVFFLVWAPFFMICQFAFLPAAVAGDGISFKKAFGMIKGIRLSFCTTYIFVAALPFIAVMFAGGVVTSVIPFGLTYVFLQFLLFELSLLLSCIAQAVMMTYAYLALK